MDPSEIVRSTDLIKLISETTPMEKDGGSDHIYIGDCPICKEALALRASKHNIFRCVVCGATGNAFDFVMLTKTISFIEAKAFLEYRLQAAPGARRGGT